VNIIEAIKSGKKFKRQGGTSWYSRMLADYPTINISAISREDFLADDWEVETTSVTITREQFDAAWRRAVDVCENMEIKTQHYLYELVVRELGL
jgi:hypothetical protein